MVTVVLQLFIIPVFPLCVVLLSLLLLLLLLQMKMSLGSSPMAYIFQSGSGSGYKEKELGFSQHMQSDQSPLLLSFNRIFFQELRSTGTILKSSFREKIGTPTGRSDGRIKTCKTQVNGDMSSESPVCSFGVGKVIDPLSENCRAFI